MMRPGWRNTLLAVAGIAATCFAIQTRSFISDARQVFSHSESHSLDARLTNVVPDQVSWLHEQHGGSWGRFGWYLGAGESGSLRVLLPGTASGFLKLRVWAFTPGHLQVSVKAVSDAAGVPIQQFDGSILHMPVHGPTELLVDASSQMPFEQLVVDRIAAVWSAPESELPSLWPSFMWLVVALACVGSWWAIHTPTGQFERERLLGVGGILLAVILGFWGRWVLFDVARGLPTEPDASMYHSYAKGFEWFTSDHGFYSGSFNEREPAHGAFLNLWFRLWGDSASALMLYTVCLSTLLIAVAGVFLWALSGLWWFGVLAAIVLAISPAWIDESIRGLRLETLSVLLLAFLSAWVWGRAWWGVLIMGVTVGLMALVQSVAFGVTIPLMWLAWIINCCRDWTKRPRLSPGQWRWTHLMAAGVLAGSMFAPHLYGIYRVHGDPFWSSDGYARWNANVEFPDRLGTAGFPSREEFEKNPYAGPRITYREYMVGLHSIPQLLVGQLKGWLESTVYMSASHTLGLKGMVFLQQASGIHAMRRHLRPLTAAVFVFSVALTAVGWIQLWSSGRYWWVPFLTLWGTWHAAYLYSVRAVEPFRHTAHVEPLLLFCLLWGGASSIRWCRELFRPSEGRMLPSALR